jgi:chromosome segregation ATPase
MPFLFGLFGKVSGLFGGLFSSLGIKNIAIIGVVASVGMWLWNNNRKLTNQQRKIIQLEKQSTEYKIIAEQANKSVEQAIQNIKELGEEYKKVRSELNRLNEFEVDVKKKLDNFKWRINREQRGKKPIEELAYTKPALVEKIINNATEKEKRCAEILSGAERKQNEKNLDCTDYGIANPQSDGM